MLMQHTMSNTQLRIATCTPVSFHANDYFYTRDTGLICRELKALGHECQVIMPLPAHDDDIQTPELLRVKRSSLISIPWWKAQNLDAVILYSWGDPRYTGIASAIHHAGCKLIIHFDSSGELHEHLQRSGSRLLNKTKDKLINIIRKIHLGYADIITTSLPCIRNFKNDAAYGSAIADKCREFPTPVERCFRYDGRAKEARIICTGSWRNPVKRTGVLMSTLHKTLAQHPLAHADICGPVTPELQHLHDQLPPGIRQRIHLHGFCRHEELKELYNRASISLCTSESEGSHAASAEALCCGCSIVCPPRPQLNVVRWYTSRCSGTVSAEDTPDSLCQALLSELENWNMGVRNATAISETWQPCFQVSALAGLI